MSPGYAPPMFCWIRRMARPMLTLPGSDAPNRPAPEWIPACVATGPDTQTISAHGWVVAWAPQALTSGARIASVAVMSTGMADGLQPAITALAAIASTVASAMRG